jgi:hypothetical protein
MTPLPSSRRKQPSRSIMNQPSARRIEEEMMNSRIRKLTTLLLTTGFLMGSTGVLAPEISDARRGGGHHGGHHGHHGGHYKKPPHHHHHHDNHHHHHHHDYDHWHDHYDHYGRWIAGAAVTSAVIGAVYYSVPCGTRVTRNGVVYYHCSDVWYRPRYQGSTVTYVVVRAP